METFNHGPIRFLVEHRAVGKDGGPTLRVCAGSPVERELLRFDCFAKGPHWHVDPGSHNEIQKIEGGSPIDWTLSELRGGLAAYLARAEFTTELPGGQDAVLDAVEDALRNPPKS